MRSDRYVLQHATLDGGGGAAVSARFRVQASLGILGGLGGGTTSGVGHGHGLVAVLNEPAQPRDDTAVRPAGLSVKTPLPTLLANDRDPEGQRLAVVRFDAVSAAGGRIVLDRGWLLYEPPAAPTAEDTFRYTAEDSAGNRTSALVAVLEAGSGPDPSQNLVAITLLPSGHRRVTFAGIAGRLYRIEWAGSLPTPHWEPLASVVADSRGMIEWVDTTEPSPPQRFYRTVAP